MAGTYPSVVQPMEQSVDNRSCMEQIADRTERLLLPSGSTRSMSSVPWRRIHPSSASSRPSNGWCVRRIRTADRRVLKLVRKWLDAGVMEEGVLRERVTGTPQGGVISPLLANIVARSWRHRPTGSGC